MAESSSTSSTSLTSSDSLSTARSTSFSTSFTSRSSYSSSSSSSIRSVTPVPVPSGFDLNLSFTNASASDNSTSTASSIREASTPPYDDDPGPFDEDTHEAGLLNYYFVFLALFVGLVFLGFFLVHRRKQRRKQRLLERGQHALARDLEGWTSSRRWYQGGWRGGDDPSNPGGTRRDPVDGLNELGDAPPPYKASESRVESRTGTRPGDAERNEEIELVARPGPSHVRQASLPPEYAVSTVSQSTVGGTVEGHRERTLT